MNKALMLFAVLFLLAFAPKEQKFLIEPSKCKLHWVGKKTTGEHSGDVSVKQGEILVKDGKPFNGRFIIDMQSITVTDIADAKQNADLVGHLKDPDFFDTAKHPEAVLVIDSFSTSSVNKYVAHARLTIKGITNAFSFPLEMKVDRDVILSNAQITIDRTKWGIVYKSKSILGSVADRFIYDDILFDVKLTGSFKK